MTYIILCVSRIVPVVDLLTLAAAFLVDAGRDPAVEEINPISRMQTIFHEIGMPFIKSAEPNPMMNTANTKYRM